MTHALVTGATGFIGYHLVKTLSEGGTTVSCLVRPSSDCSRIESFDPRLITGDVTDADSVAKSLDGVDVVYHLAGMTKSLSAKMLAEVNEQGVRNVAQSCANHSRPPVLVVTSSLAAAGPSTNEKPKTETDTPNPVSGYGRSKRAGELAAIEHAGKVPTTIVRPPIVLGEGDRDGYELYNGIARFGIHLVPGRKDHKFSLIHAEDLATALIGAAERGQRLPASGEQDSGQGIYFAAADEMPTYADLGRLIGEVIDHRVRVVRNPMPLVWMICAAAHTFSVIRRKPHILSLDKAREAIGGAWSCSNEAIKRDTGFTPGKSLRGRLDQTAQWYIDQGWLRQPKRWIEMHQAESEHTVQSH